MINTGLIERKLRGFTLTETMVTVLVLGILATMVIIPHQKTLERGRWRAAVDVLESIYAGERTYWASNDKYCTIGNGAGECTWDNIFVEDPTRGVLAGAAVTVVGGAATFSATVTRTVGSCPWVVGIDQTRSLIGTNTTIDSVCP